MKLITLSVPDYDIIHPVEVDSEGNLLARDQEKARRKRALDTLTNEELFWKFEAFGRDYHVNVTRNDRLFSSDFVVEIRQANGTTRYEFDTEHCHYVGQLMSPAGHTSMVALSDCDGLVRSLRPINYHFTEPQNTSKYRFILSLANVSGSDKTVEKITASSFLSSSRRLVLLSLVTLF